MSSTLDESPVDSYEGLLLVGREVTVEPDRLFDRRGRPVAVPGFGIQQAGLREHGLCRYVERLGDVLEDVRRRLVHAALELAQVRVRDLRHLGQLPEREIRELALRLQELAECSERFVRPVAHIAAPPFTSAPWVASRATERVSISTSTS